MSSEEHVDSLDIPSWLVTAIYAVSFIIAGIVYMVLHAFWGRYVLLHFSDIDHPLSSTGLGKVWFIFAWALLAPAVIAMIWGRPRSSLSKPVQIAKGLWLSLNAGFFEELIYRWLVFFTAMIVLPFFNLITFGFVKWFYTMILVPLANLATLHALSSFLLHHGSWVFGAAIVSAAADFRDEHKYLGWFGWINSWFGGMVMFYLALNYGLWTAIVAHILYDAIVFTFRGLVSKPDYFLFGRRSRFI